MRLISFLQRVPFIMNQQQNDVFNLNFLFSEKNNRSYLGALGGDDIDVLRGRFDGTKKDFKPALALVLYDPIGVTCL